MLRQGPPNILPPASGNASAQGNVPQLPSDQGNATQQQPQVNITISQLPADQGNATQQQPQVNITIPQLPADQGNATQQQPQPDISITQLPEDQGNATQQQPQVNITFPQLPDIAVQNISGSAIPEQQMGGDFKLPQAVPQGGNLPSTTVVNVDSPVISVNGEALGSVQSDLISIGIQIENESGKADESLLQTQQKVNELNAKLKEMGLEDNNILNLGLFFNLRQQNQSGAGNQTDSSSNTNNSKLFVSSQVEIQVNNITLAGKIIDLLNSQNFKIKYIEYNYQPDTFIAVIESLTASALADAENRAISSIANTGAQLGQLLNLNVNVDKDYQNIMNMQAENNGIGKSFTNGMKVIRVTVSATYALQGKLQSHRRKKKPYKPGKAANATQMIEARNATNSTQQLTKP